MINDQLQNIFESSFIVGAATQMVPHEALVQILEQHPLASEFKADNKLQNMLSEMEQEDSNLQTDYQIRLNGRTVLRRVLTICKDNGIDVRVDLSFAR